MKYLFLLLAFIIGFVCAVFCFGDTFGSFDKTRLKWGLGSESQECLKFVSNHEGKILFCLPYNGWEERFSAEASLNR